MKFRINELSSADLYKIGKFTNELTDEEINIVHGYSSSETVDIEFILVDDTRIRIFGLDGEYLLVQSSYMDKPVVFRWHPFDPMSGFDSHQFDVELKNLFEMVRGQ